MPNRIVELYDLYAPETHVQPQISTVSRECSEQERPPESGSQEDVGQCGFVKAVQVEVGIPWGWKTHPNTTIRSTLNQAHGPVKIEYFCNGARCRCQHDIGRSEMAYTTCGNEGGNFDLKAWCKNGP